MLGTVIGLTDLIQPESIMKVLAHRIPAVYMEMNRTALTLGLEMAAPFKK